MTKKILKLIFLSIALGIIGYEIYSMVNPSVVSPGRPPATFLP